MSTHLMDVLAIAPHPDDGEIFCGATLALLASKGYSVSLLHLTAGELSTQGDVETRREERKSAAALLGLQSEDSLNLPDGALSEGDPSQIAALVRAIRSARPEVLLLPYWEDRHPDHRQASLLGTRAVFLANLRKFLPEAGNAHHVLQTAYYQLRTRFKPSFIVDVTSVYEKKLQAIAAYKSQVQRDRSGANTLISSELSVSSIQARDEHYGSMIGVKYGEPFLLKTAIGIPDPVAFFRQHPVKEPLGSPEVL